jgi:diguanylate cyclase (GGDEF)-like protein
METATGPEFARVSWHRVGTIGSLIGLFLMMLAAAVNGHLFHSVADGLFLVGAAAAALVLYRLLRGHRSANWWFCWPVLGLVLIFLFRLVDPVAAGQVAGLFYVIFLFTGLTQPRGRSLLLVPFALATLYSLLQITTGPGVDLRVRLCAAAFGWAVSAELPALILRRLVLQQKVLETNAETDALTGLRNRHGLEQLLDETRGDAFLVLLDLDHFKRYNDTYGHLAGDKVLADFAAMLLRQSRSKDFVVRYGGEEFLIVLTGVDQRMAERIVARWADVWSSNPYGITFSAGITDSSGPESLGRADALLYAAKSAGRNRIKVEIGPR